MTEATRTIQFNTGRKYTAEGQVITATLYADGTVTFMDHSRMIDGEFKNGGTDLLASNSHAGDDPRFAAALRAEVMAAYDGSNYQGSRRSSRDGMMTGGRNTRDGFEVLAKLKALPTPEDTRTHGLTALNNLLADLCGSLDLPRESADEVLAMVAAEKHGDVWRDVQAWIMDFIVAWGKAEEEAEEAEEWHVLGDGDVVLEICPTRAAAESFVHGYTRHGNWGGYAFIHIGNKVTGEAKTFTAPEAEDAPELEELGGLGVRTDKYPDYLDDGEREVIDALIVAALEDGYSIEVQGEGETDLEASTDYAEITDMVAATCETTLVMRKPGTKAFWFQCIHGNAPWEVIADHVVTDAANALIAKVQPIIDRLEAEGA